MEKVKITYDYKFEKEVLEYLNPEFVYIPLANHTNLKCKCMVKKGESVYKDSVVGIREDHFKLPILSTVSGEVLDINKMTYINGEEVACVVIKNDFKEEYKTKPVKVEDITKYTKEEVVDLMQSLSITGMGGSDFPTYVKYKTDSIIKHLVVNAVECEPYIKSDYETCTRYSKEILSAIDALVHIFDMESAVIVIKDKNKKMIDAINDYLGTYPKISIKEVDDYYPAGYEKNTVYDALKITYDKLPIEKGIVVNNITTMYAIFLALKYHVALDTKFVTVSGDIMNKNINVHTKIGSLVSDVLELVTIKETEDKCNLIMGGPMMGNAIDTDFVCITKSTNSIILKTDENIRTIACLRCGACTNVCPVKLSPALINENLNNIEMLKKLKADKCISCGLCTFICPSKLYVREAVNIAKNKLREEVKNG